MPPCAPALDSQHVPLSGRGVGPPQDVLNFGRKMRFSGKNSKNDDFSIFSSHIGTLSIVNVGLSSYNLANILLEVR